MRTTLQVMIHGDIKHLWSSCAVFDIVMPCLSVRDLIKHLMLQEMFIDSFIHYSLSHLQIKCVAANIPSQPSSLPSGCLEIFLRKEM